MTQLFGVGLKASAAAPQEPLTTGDVDAYNPRFNDGVFKAYMPEYLYNPPFGYPRSINYPLVRQLTRNPYVYSVVKTVADQAATAEWDVVFKEGFDVKENPELDKLRLDIKKFLSNPNRNKESFADIVRPMVKDALELDSGVWVKTFNMKGQLVQLFARDGASFLKNPDIYGYFGNREPLIKPLAPEYLAPEAVKSKDVLQRYSFEYKNAAAYFQYGNSPAALPVPFGTREIVYFELNKRTDSVYGQSPVQILADIITTLVYGANYNLDFYMNANMPEGIISFIGAGNDQVRAMRERLENVGRITDPGTGMLRRKGYNVGYTNVETKFTPFQLNPRDMEVIAQQEWFTKVLWMCFGVTADEMGFTENSNKAVGAEQTKAHARKAIKPLLQQLKYRIDHEIIPEWGPEAYDALEFSWVENDLDEDKKNAELQQMYISMGIKTPEMVAEDLGIDWSEVEATRESQMEHEADKAGAMAEAEGGNEEPAAPDYGLKTKYIRREGSSGNYKYYYDEPKDKSPKNSEELNDNDKQDLDKIKEQNANVHKAILTFIDSLPPATAKKLRDNDAAYNARKDTYHEHSTDGKVWSDKRKKVHAEIFSGKSGHEHVALHKPEAAPKSAEDKVFVFFAGAPGTGKSKLEAEYDLNSFAVINPDNYKAALPEYDGGDGAALVHEESSHLAHRAMKHHLKKGNRIIYDGTFKSTGKIEKLMKQVKKAGYTVHLRHVTASAETVVKRIEKRYRSKGRFVSPIFAVKSIEPIKQNVARWKDEVHSFKHVDNEEEEKQ